MSRSLIYRSALGYELLMRALYGRHYGERMRVVAEHVPRGSSVLECCCGPGTLYLRHLRAITSGYIGLDVNDRFVRRLQLSGIDAREVDLAGCPDPLPQADVVIMQASLYHFLPGASEIVAKMLAAARDRVIVAEPIRNLACSRVPLVGFIGRRAADPGAGGHAQRFTEQMLDELMSRYRDRTLATFKVRGGREKGYVLAGGAPDPAASTGTFDSAVSAT